MAQTAIMVADHANNLRQTELMEEQLKQDFDLAIAEIESDKQAAASTENLMRELNNNIVNVMGSIEKRLGDISNKLENIGQYIRSDFENIQIFDNKILFKDSAILFEIVIFESIQEMQTINL